MSDIRKLVGSVTEVLEKNVAELSNAPEQKVTQLSEALDAKVAEVESRSAQLDRSVEEFEEEKRMVSTLPLHTDGDAQVIELNVGGTIFQTKRGTLRAAQGSLLATIFSGRWEESLDRDKEGRPFFDFDPAHFRIVLNHLRLRCLTKREEVLPPVQQPEHPELFEAMVDFLCLRDFLHGCCAQAAALVCTKVGTEDSFEIDGPKISGGTSVHHRVAVGKAPLLSSSHTSSAAWKVSFPKLAEQGWVYAGIIGNTTPDQYSCGDLTSYGWSANGFVWTAGQGSNSGPHLRQGDCAIFRLDAVGKRLRMYVERTGQIHNISLPEGAASQARLHFNLWRPGTEMVVSGVTPDDVSRAGL